MDIVIDRDENGVHDGHRVGGFQRIADSFGALRSAIMLTPAADALADRLAVIGRSLDRMKESMHPTDMDLIHMAVEQCTQRAHDLAREVRRLEDEQVLAEKAKREPKPATTETRPMGQIQPIRRRLRSGTGSITARSRT